DSPRFGEVKLQKLRRAPDPPADGPDIEAQDEFAVGLRAQPLDEAFGQIPAAARDGEPNSQEVLPPNSTSRLSAAKRFDQIFRSKISLALKCPTVKVSLRTSTASRNSKGVSFSALRSCGLSVAAVAFEIEPGPERPADLNRK